MTIKKKLGDVFKTTSGGTPSRTNPAFYNGNIPWVKSGELEANIIYDTEEKITKEAIAASSAKVFPKGTLLIALYGATIGKLAKLGIDAATNQAVCGIFENEEHDLSYLYWFLYHRRRDLAKAGIGGAQPNISQTILKSLEIPLPPKEIQYQIVSKIEELFSELDKGIEELKTAQQQLKVYRQAVLKWAFEGKLTNEGVKDGELQKRWYWTELNQIAQIVSGYAFKSTDFKDKGVPVIKISNIGYSAFVWKDQEFLPDSHLELHKNFAIHSDDLLIALTRPITNNTTKVCKYPKNATAGLLNQRVASIKEIKGDKEFLFWYFQTDSFKNYIRSKFSETLQPNLSPKDLAQTPVPFWSIEEQQQIVQEIESRLSVCDKIEETITNSLKQAEILRQSILKKAFEGNLL